MKLTQIIFATTLTLASSTSVVVLASETDEHTNHQQVAEQQKAIKTQGVVKEIDLDNKKVTIAHEPIAELNWPAMTMRFTTEDVAMIQDLKPNDTVDFTFIQEGNLSMLQSIDVTP